MGRVAIVDTVALVLLVETPEPGEPSDRPRRREANRLTFSKLQRLGTRFIIPTPVIAELCKEGSGLALIRDKVVSRLQSIRTEPLDAMAADIAGAMRRSTLSDRQGRERGAVSYDALIAAIAHRIGAKWLLTANPDDMKRCLAAVSSPVEVLDTTGIPTHGQLDLLAHQQPRGEASSVE